MDESRRAFLVRLAAIPAAAAITLIPAAAAAKPPGKKKVVRPLSRKGKASELPVVKHVGDSRLTVGGTHYVIDEFTDIIVNGEEASLDDVQVGMQASVAGTPVEFGETRADSLFRATRIVARTDNQLAKRAAEANKKAADQARKANQKSKRKR